MKYLVIAAILFLLLLIYSRVRPYIKMAKKFVGVVKDVTGSPADGARGTNAKSDSKLVRCVSCGTWIPANRAIGAGKGSATYCSRECLEKTPKERKLAG